MNNIRRNITGESVQEVWLKLLTELSLRPEHKSAPRGISTSEITGMRLEIRDLRKNIIHHPIRNINYKFMVAEWLWITYGLNDLAVLTRYNGQMSRFSDDGKTLAGAYGPRLIGQWEYVLSTLRKDPDSRQAVATIWTPNPEPSKDIPCTISQQFIQRDNRLNLIVTMRSSDAWLGIPYDCFVFSQLANSIAGELGLNTGYLMMQLGSSHLYDDNAQKARDVLDQPNLASPLSSPPLPGWPTPALADVLVNPTVNVDDLFAPPWNRYAQVLRAQSWREARNLLHQLSEQ